MALSLSDVSRCLQGIVPSPIATCDAGGTPNITYASHVTYVDERHVALSCQFFNKTRRNIAENPFACVLLHDPVTLQAYRLALRFECSETGGKLFDAMALRIEVIASHTGMTGIFKLLSADIFEVESVERVEGYLQDDAPEVEPAPATHQAHGELRGLQLVSERINRSRDLEELLGGTLAALDEAFGFTHGMVLLPDEQSGRLVATMTHGYADAEVGAEVALGEGVIGTVAKLGRPARLSSMGSELRYGRAIRGRVQEEEGGRGLLPEIPLPGLADAQAQLVLPLRVEEVLVGVLALESPDPLCFEPWHEAFLDVIANQIALGIERMARRAEPEEGAHLGQRDVEPPGAAAARHRFTYYRNDDCVFLDGEYLIKNIPAKILWKVLTAWEREGKSEFANRELRLDPTLGLPPIKDNLESRLILLRKRLEAKCPGLRLVPTRRGRFSVVATAEVELVEKDSG